MVLSCIDILSIWTERDLTPTLESGVQLLPEFNLCDWCYSRVDCSVDVQLQRLRSEEWEGLLVFVAQTAVRV